MFIGHFGVALAARRVAPGLKLGTAFAAAQLLDLIWPVLVLAGVERVVVAPGTTAVTPLDFESYPYSHSLLTTLVWSALFAAVIFWRTRSSRTAFVAGLLVTSHWVLDYVSHRPDMPLSPFGGPKVGLGLWSSLPATLLVEASLFAAGIVLYVRATRPVDRQGSLGFWALIGFLAAAYAGNVFGPPPPVGTPSAAIAGPAMAMWLLVLWGGWVDRHRTGTLT